VPLDYRVTLDCGHTHLYRTTVHPRDREQLTCDECGQGHRAAQVSAVSSDQCEFHHFTRRTAWVGSSPEAHADPPHFADAS
jgi:ribosome modulation factor